MLALYLAALAWLSPDSIAERLHLPTTDEGNLAAVAARLVDREECDDDLDYQPHDCPERARWALLTISNRESPGNWTPNRRWVGVRTYQGDHKHSAKIGRRMRERGRFQAWCPFHWGDEGFSTVGPHGLIYGFNVQRGRWAGNCVPWQYVAAPMQSARLALDRYLDKCEDEPEPGRRSWCPRIAQVVATRDRFDARAAKRARSKKRRATATARRLGSSS